MTRMIHNEVLAMLQQSEQTQPMLITDAHLTGLPEPVQCYLRYAGVVGKEPIRTVRLTQRGSMRQQPGQKWHPASGDFTWFRFKITEIEYDQSGRVTRV